MSNKTHKISDVIPVDNDLFGGEISMDCEFSFNSKYISRTGDLICTGFDMVSDFGTAYCTMLGKRHFFAISETYKYKQGLVCTTRITQPIIELHFQLGGSARGIQSSLDYPIDMNPGEANLIIIPPLSDRFELKEKLDGNIFSIMLSKDYIVDLSDRFPHLMEPVISKINQKDFCVLKKNNLPITPRMRGVIQRIKDDSNGHITGSLFLESQILDLLSQFFSQLRQPASMNGNTLSRSDKERIRRARELILNHLDSPPSLAELSRLVGTNEFKLKSGFKEMFGTSPYAYHLQQKMELARSYILDTDLTIAEISYRIGYSDPSHFSTAFRKQYGIRPTDLR